MYVYKHVGSQVSFADTLQPEITSRLASMRSATGSLKQSFFVGSHPPKVKAKIMQAVLLSKGLYNASTWPALNEREAHRVHTALFQTFTICLPKPNTNSDTGNTTTSKTLLPQAQRTSYKQVTEQLATPTPDVLLRVLRLRLYARLVAKNRPGLYDALVRGLPARRSWLAADHDDLTCFARQTNVWNDHVDAPLQVWRNCVANAPREFTNKLKQASRHPKLAQRYWELSAPQA